MGYQHRWGRQVTAMRRTNWLVLTGASCAGKTTTGRKVAQRLGCRFVEEPVRLYIDEQISSGRLKDEVVHELMSDRKRYQEEALAMRIRLEESLDPDEPLILDRGIPDSIGYFKLWDINPLRAEIAASTFRYRAVAWLAPLTMVKDDIRLENEYQRARLSSLLLDAYRSEGYEVLNVPVDSLDERVANVVRLIRQSLDGIRS